MTDPTRLTFSAYLFARDTDSTLHANTLLENLFELAESIGDNVNVLVAIDSIGHDGSYSRQIPRQAVPAGNWKCFRVDSSGVHDSEVAEPPHTLKEGFDHFVTFVSKNRAVHGPHVFLISGHGVPGGGLPGKLRKWILSPAASDLIAEALRQSGAITAVALDRDVESQANTRVDKLSDARILVSPEIGIPLVQSLYSSVATQFQKTKFFEADRTPREQAVLLAGMLRFAEQHEMEHSLGVTHVAYSPQRPEKGLGRDVLSVTEVASALKSLTHQDCGSLIDNLFLHSCVLGIVDVFYEFHDVAHCVTASPQKVQGASCVSQWFKPDDPTAPWRLRGTELGTHIVISDQASRPCRGRHFVCVRGDGYGAEWRKMINALSRFCQLIRQSDPATTSDAISLLFRASRDCSLCIREVRDLLEVVDNLQEKVNLSNILSDVFEAQGGVVVRQFSSYPCKRECNCGQAGMTLFTPSSINDIPPEYTPTHGNGGVGYRLLDAVPWLDVLRSTLHK